MLEKRFRELFCQAHNDVADEKRKEGLTVRELLQDEKFRKLLREESKKNGDFKISFAAAPSWYLKTRPEMVDVFNEMNGVLKPEGGEYRYRAPHGDEIMTFITREETIDQIAEHEFVGGLILDNNRIGIRPN